MVGEGALEDPKQRRGRNGLFKVHLLIERIAFAIVPVEVRYPDRIVGIALLL